MIDTERRTKKKTENITSYHLGPSAQILISFSLNSNVCLSIVLRSNLDASTRTSDLSGVDAILQFCSFCTTNYNAAANRETLQSVNKKKQRYVIMQFCVSCTPTPIPLTPNADANATTMVTYS